MLNKISKTNVIEFFKYFLLSIILIYLLIYNINLLIERSNNLKGHNTKVIGTVYDTNHREYMILPFNIIWPKSTNTVNVKYTYDDNIYIYIVKTTEFNELNIPKSIKYIFRERCVVYLDSANPSDGQASIENGRVIPTLMIVLIMLIIINGIINIIFYFGPDESNDNSSEASSNNIAS